MPALHVPRVRPPVRRGPADDGTRGVDALAVYGNSSLSRHNQADIHLSGFLGNRNNYVVLPAAGDPVLFAHIASRNGACTRASTLPAGSTSWGARDYDDLLDKSRGATLSGVARNIKAPLRVVHGELDNLNPAEDAYRTYEQASGPKQWVCYPEGMRSQGVDSDNGFEFINISLLRYCQERDIRFTRGRPYKKDDNAHIEQKNWTYVRKLLGYDRFDSPAALAAINELYRHQLRLMMNLSQPCVKLREKHRIGARLTVAMTVLTRPSIACSPRVWGSGRRLRPSDSSGQS